MTEPTVHILLASHNGQAYLVQQLESIAIQTWLGWSLLVSDDGSTDHTKDIAARFASKVAQPVRLIHGPCKGVAHNFFQLINSVHAGHANDVYAFCDQDDVWLPNKLERAITHYLQQNLPPEQPYLYCGRTQVVDEKLHSTGFSPTPHRPLGFGNALLQNIASGNTMVFNGALLSILRKIDPVHCVMHDWSAYQVATACDGLVYYDSKPCLLYRQHGANVIGNKTGLRRRLKRLGGILKGDYRNWANQTEAAMDDIRACLSPSAVQQLHQFSLMRDLSNPVARAKTALKSGLWTQAPFGKTVLLLIIFFGLI